MPVSVKVKLLVISSLSYASALHTADAESIAAAVIAEIVLLILAFINVNSLKLWVVSFND